MKNGLYYQLFRDEVKRTMNLVGDFIRKTKWTPLQIALAINEIRNPTSFATKAEFLTIETALKLLPLILSALYFILFF